MKWRTVVSVMLCGLMLSGCIAVIGAGRPKRCPFEDQHERFEEHEMDEGEFSSEVPGEHEEHLEERMRELEMRAEEINRMERHLAEQAEELERRAAELEGRE
jgi:TolA-binding protein